MNMKEPFFLYKPPFFAIPIIHYNMEIAGQVKRACEIIKPDCVAVELAETMQLQLLHAASRLPDISVVVAYSETQTPLYYLSEPCDPAFEALRSALESRIPAWCIDLDIDNYPLIEEDLPDPYAIQRIGLKNYYEAYARLVLEKNNQQIPQDTNREMYMAKRLKELSFSYEKILFVGGMAHIQRVLNLVDRSTFPVLSPAKRKSINLLTLDEASTRDVLAECPWFSLHYEESRKCYAESKASTSLEFPPDRQKLIFSLFKQAAATYVEKTGNPFPGYHQRNLMKYLRNYAWIRGRLMPDLYQILSAAKSCVDDNFAYYVWELASHYPYRKNIDGLEEQHLSVEDVWGKSKKIKFNFKLKNAKSNYSFNERKNRSKTEFLPPGRFSICSYPPEDILIERFGSFLKKKGKQILQEEGARTLPFSTSLEDGIDTKETIRHFHEKKTLCKDQWKTKWKRRIYCHHL